LNEQAVDGFLKREFIDTKHAYVVKKKAHGVIVWLGLKLKSSGWYGLDNGAHHA
jgi:hypothetical protein